eukprot:scaffold10353_cov127-Isochrysis_galbana.AAC.14
MSWQLHASLAPPHVGGAFLPSLLRTVAQAISPARDLWTGGDANPASTHALQTTPLLPDPDSAPGPSSAPPPGISPQGDAAFGPAAPPGFAHIWSSLEFLFCSAPWEDGALDNARLFGAASANI